MSSKMKFAVIIIDIVLMVASVAGVLDLKDYYVPWKARPSGNTRTNSPCVG